VKLKLGVVELLGLAGVDAVITGAAGAVLSWV